MDRRDLLRAAAALPLLRAASPDQAFAQSYPARNITMIVPFPAGGQADLAARPVAMALERILGKPVIVDNRAGGGGGSVGNAATARKRSRRSMVVPPPDFLCFAASLARRSARTRRLRSANHVRSGPERIPGPAVALPGSE